VGKIFASADIGSNTVHLLVAEVSRGGLKRIENLSEWIGLGEVVAREGVVPPEQQMDLLEALRSFREISEQRRARQLYIFATEAMRRASNHREVLARIWEEAGVEVEVVSPRREAELSARGVELDVPLGDFGLLFEVGGGSAQIASLRRGEVDQEQSLAIGTGALSAEVGLEAPCSAAVDRVLQNLIASRVSELQVSRTKGSAVASGGVARGLLRALHPDGDPVLLRHEVEYLAWSTRRLRHPAIAARFRVKARRAATLFPGALVYLELMRHFDLEEIHVSEYGVREGAILERARQEEAR
jgi:exopolyphosphatase / guanosine-5'-triphosphate,3'-diphosphate pyrophosphatase